MYDFDVVLGMDWLTTHYREKRLCFSPLNAQSFEFQGTLRGQTIPIIFAHQAKKLLDSGSRGYFANIFDSIK